MAGWKTAKDNMTTAVPVAKRKERIGDVEKRISKKSGCFDAIDYIYVVDENGIFYGVVPIKELIGAANKNSKIERLVKGRPTTVHPLVHQEKVVYAALSHGLSSVPVVDKEGRFLGAVPYKKILETFNYEVHEDVLKFGGVFHKVGREFTTITSPAMHMIKARLPWLLLGVAGGTVAASIVGGFEGMVMDYIALAAFIPLLVYMSDAAGTQSETIMVRTMAVDPKFKTAQYLARELKIAIILGGVCGALVGAVAAVGWGNLPLSMTVGISMFASILASVCIATLLPLVFRKLNFDPAVAAGPFATILSDIATLLIYFTTATFLLGCFG